MPAVTTVFLFDIDGTLIESGGAGRDALDLAMQLEFGVTVEEPVDLHGRTDRGIGHELLQRHGLPDTDENWRRLRQRYVGLLPQTLRRRVGRVLPGVAELLESLGEANAALGLLTGNMRAGAEIKLQHFCLAERLTWFGGFGDRHASRDRVAADAVEDAESHLGRPVDVERIWIVGDTPRDIQCARAVGANVAAVATGGFDADELSEHGPDMILQSLVTPQPLLDVC